MHLILYITSYLCDDKCDFVYGMWVVTGMHTGEVLMFSVTDNGDVVSTEKVSLHSSPVTALASHGQVLVSGDDAGTLVVAQENGSLSKICSVDSYE